MQMGIRPSIEKYINIKSEAASLAAFRVLFGLLMMISLIRFAYNGWIEKLYVLPPFHFKYWGFGWVQDWAEWTYLLFVICGLCALGVTLGYRYRLSILGFFLSFTYIELIDKTTYLNHYYFISCLSFLMIWLPMHHYYSVDAYKGRVSHNQSVPRWTVDAIKLMLGIVYVYAGVAKLHSDWLLEAQPMRIWMSGMYDIPLIGDLLIKPETAYLFSWSGLLYDISIPFLLLWRPTRNWAFITVVIFHILTRVLFSIGMFPFIMIISTLIFFDAQVHHKILGWISSIVRIPIRLAQQNVASIPRIFSKIVLVFFIIQLLFPWRYLAYPDKLFWTEEGYRFSWRVMLMEKAGTANFKIVDGKTGKRFYVRNRDFLTSFQEKQMATQPDFILEYAHYLADHFSSQGHENVEVYVDSYVTLNGRMSQRFVDPNVNLRSLKEGWNHKDWILPYPYEH